MGNSLVKERSSETTSSSNETTLVTSLTCKKDIICTSEDADGISLEAVDTYTWGCISIGGFFSGKSSGKGDNIVDIIPTATSASTNSSETTISTTSSLTNSDGLVEDSLSRPPESLSPKNLKWLQETITESEQSIIDLRKRNKSLLRELGKNYNPNDDGDDKSPGQRPKCLLKKYLEELENGGITLKEDHLALVTKYALLSTEEAELLEEEHRLLVCKGNALEEKTKKLEEEGQRLDSKIEIRKIVRESKKEAIDQEKSQIIQEECQKLKTETDSIQKRILDDLKDFELKQHQQQQAQKSTNTNDTVTTTGSDATGEEAELFETLETEMLRLHDEAEGIRDDLDQKQIDFTGDLTKNYKLRKSWATKSQQSKGLTLKVRQCFNKKRADLADWVDRSFIECGVCQKNLPEALGSSHLKFCSECSCHVCFRCDCEPFHLANQELALYATEEADQEKRISKKMKKKRKKGRKKENAKKKQVMNSQVLKDECGGDDANDSNVAGSGIIDEISRDNNKKSNKSKDNKKSAQRSSSPTTVLSLIDDEERDDCHDDYEVRRNKKFFEGKQLAEADKGAASKGIDFVTHLEETGSMIALSNLMNELEGKGVDLDEGHEGVASFQDTVQRSVLKEIKSNGVWYI